MKSRALFPSGTYLITRRTHHGLFRLAPTARAKRICLFCLMHSAFKYEVEVHAFCFMSNHFHVVATDPLRQLDRFMHWLDLYIAKCLNVLHGCEGIVWEPDQPGVQLLVTPEDVLDKIVYVICNPVRAGLVEDPSRWTGVISLPRHHAEGHVFTEKRPEVYFSKKSEVVPEESSLVLSVPPGFETDEAFYDALEREVRNTCLEIREEFGRTERQFLGKENISLDHAELPAVPLVRVGIRPYIACKDRVLRKEVLAWYKRFWKEHEEARLKVRKEEKNVVFPFGTNWWSRHVRVPCIETPPAWLGG